MISLLPSIADATRQIRDRKLQPFELVEYCVNRIRRYEERIRAWVWVDADGARREAENLERRVSAGDWPGPLTGIPMAIKDIVDLAGQPTKAGSKLRETHRAQCDAPVVTRLRSAGAIILGKTVTTEWACFDPPRTRNPWNLGHTPGGSSSGSAASVALEMCGAAIGSQTGGSIIRPASYCGVAGFKPTLDRVSRTGVVPVSPHLDHVGPIARTAQDLSTVFAVIRNQGPVDGQTPSSRPTLLSFEGFFWETSDTDIRRITQDAIRELSQLWPLFESALPASFAQVHAMHRRIMTYDLAHDHGSCYRLDLKNYGPKVGSLIREGLDVSPAAYEEALGFQLRFRRDMTATITMGTVAVMPATNFTAPASLDTTGDPMFNSPWSLAGLPAVTIPCGCDASGMPCGLQLVGPWGADEWLLAVAQEAQNKLQFTARPSLPMS